MTKLDNGTNEREDVAPRTSPSPDLLLFTEEAMIFMDLAKTLIWKHLYEDVTQILRNEGRRIATRDDVSAVLSAAMAGALAQLRLEIDEKVNDPDAEAPRSES